MSPKPNIPQGSADIAVLRERLDITMKNFEDKLNDLSAALKEGNLASREDVAEIRREFSNNMDRLNLEIQQKADEHRKLMSNYVMNVEFAQIKFIIVAIFISTIGQFGLKYFMHW